MTEFDVRPATPEDADALAAVYRSAYRESRELGFPMKAASVSREEILEWLEESQVHVASAGGEVVAGVRLDVTDPDRVKLSRLGVHDDWKGEGIGSRLMAHAENRVRKQGYGTIWLTTPEDHPYLPEWYRRLGYEKTGPYPLEYRDYDEIILEKQLE